MKAAELIEGEAYALDVPGQEAKVRVRLLRPSNESAQKVWVRVEDLSSSVGTEMEVPKRRLAVPWNVYRADSVTLVDTDAFYDVAWLPEPAEEVECDDTGALRWTVTSVDLKAGTAVITSTPFTRFQARTVMIERLQPAVPLPVPSAEELKLRVFDSGAAPLRFKSPKSKPARPQSKQRRARSGDISPKAVADRLIFGEIACRQYKQHVEPKCRKGDEAKRMRREVRNHGRIRRVNPGEPRYRRGEYLRYRVQGKFEVVLFGSPQKLPQDIHVKRIEIIRRRGQRRRDGRHK